MQVDVFIHYEHKSLNNYNHRIHFAWFFSFQMLNLFTGKRYLALAYMKNNTNNIG